MTDAFPLLRSDRNSNNDNSCNNGIRDVLKKCIVRQRISLLLLITKN